MKVNYILFLISSWSVGSVSAFSKSPILYHTNVKSFALKRETLRHMAENEKQPGSTSGDNMAMAFLRKIGKVGGAANKDFVNAMGVDEGPVGKNTAEGGMKVCIGME